MPIFVSYRRGETDHVTGRIYDRLKGAFPQEEIFLDIDAIPIGIDFHELLGKWVERSDIFLAIIGQDWDVKRLQLVADLSGKAIELLPSIAERRFFELDRRNFALRMKSARPRVEFTVPNTLTGQGCLAVDLTFETLEDFSPGSLENTLGVTRL